MRITVLDCREDGKQVLVEREVSDDWFGAEPQGKTEE